MTKTKKQISEIGSNTGQAQHTPEPWIIYRDIVAEGNENAGTRILGIRNICEIARVPSGFEQDPVDEANARRICAAVNACQGISTEALEQGVVAEVLEALREVIYDASRYDEEGGLQPITLKTLAKVRIVFDKGTGKPA